MFKKLMIVGIIVFVSFLTIIVSTLFTLNVSTDKPEKPTDIIVSLGGGDGSRVEKAWELYKKLVIERLIFGMTS